MSRKEKFGQTVLFISPFRFRRILIILAMIMPGGFAAHPAELDGVQVPDTLHVDGKTLHLNGYGQLTYSILGIHIYVASLYLEHLSTSAEEISGPQRRSCCSSDLR